MFVRSTYWMWTSGKFTVTLTAGLDPRRSYLITGALTGKSGGDYGQVYISTVCTQRSSDQILCGIRGAPPDPFDTCGFRCHDRRCQRGLRQTRAARPLRCFFTQVTERRIAHVSTGGSASRFEAVL